MNITRILFFGLAIFFSINFYGQNNVNDYKYVIVPEGYVFLKENDDYQLNSLTKFLFKKYGFTAFIRGEELPEDLKINGCKGLRANVKKKSGLLKTRLTIELVDCNETVVFRSKEGVSREKEFKKSYHEALRNAFKDVKLLNYKYNNKKETLVKKETPSIRELQAPAQAVVKDKVPTATKNSVSTITNTQSKLPKEVEPPVRSFTYEYNNEIFVFEKQEYGFELLQNKNEKFVSIGKIFKSNRDNNYIIKAGELSGNGYFDAYRNFILERINPATNKLITDTFARQ